MKNKIMWKIPTVIHDVKNILVIKVNSHNLINIYKTLKDNNNLNKEKLKPF
jgi:hypothetical protein